MKRKLEDIANESNKSSRYATRATTIEGSADHATDPRKGNSSNNNEGRAMLQKASELLGEYRAEFQRINEAIKEQNEIISSQQEVIRDLKEAAEEQQNTAQELSQQLEDTKKQMGNELKRIREQLEDITASAAATPHISFADVLRWPPSSQSHLATYRPRISPMRRFIARSTHRECKRKRRS
jgi:chromosome segregation ATPase